VEELGFDRQARGRDDETLGTTETARASTARSLCMTKVLPLLRTKQLLSTDLMLLSKSKTV
jgi:hypothetical protein